MNALFVAALLVVGVFYLVTGVVTDDPLLFVIGCIGLGAGLQELYFEFLEH